MIDRLRFLAIKHAASLLKKDKMDTGVYGKLSKNHEINEARKSVASQLERKAELVNEFLYEGASSRPDKVQISITILNDFVDGICTKVDVETYKMLKIAASKYTQNIKQ